MTDTTRTPGASPAEPESTRPSLTSRLGWPTVVISIVFGLFYAYYLWDALRSLIVLPAELEEMGFGRESAPWALLITGVVVPILAFVLAFVLGLRRNFLSKVLLFLAGIAAVACLSLSVIALA